MSKQFGKPTVKKLVEDSGVPEDLAQCFIEIMKEDATQVQETLDLMYRVNPPDVVLTRAVEWARNLTRAQLRMNPDWHKLNVLNILGGFYGVEYLGCTATGLHVEYLNAGDSYTPTLIKVGDKFIWTSIGDYLESHPRFQDGGKK